jgi:co-chaperonin GroES (HSP10)
MKLFNDLILVRLDPESDKLASGLFKPEKAHEHVFRTGEVVDTGPGQWAKKASVRIPTGVQKGDGVIFVKFVATHTETAKSIQKVIGKELALLHQSDIVLVYDRNDPPEISQ